MTGHWQKEIPSRSGEYWTADRDGLLAGLKVVFRTATGEVHAPSQWQGWWWSEPVEKPPKPPEWGEIK